METGLTIQQVAQQTGLSIDTLRYYERIGLLEPVGRAQNGHRRYTQHDLAWIDLLMRLRDTGMPRAQMVRFAELRRQGSASLTERRLMLEQHQHSQQQHMQELEQHMATLQHKIARIKELEAQQDVAYHYTHIFHTRQAPNVRPGRPFCRPICTTRLSFWRLQQKKFPQGAHRDLTSSRKTS